MHPMMTPRCLEVLRSMLKAHEAQDWDNAEIVQDGDQCWLGDERISPRTVNRLLQLCLIRHEAMGGCDHYTINEEGRRMVADPNYTPLIDAELRKLAVGLD
jgi:hypothetical protein